MRRRSRASAGRYMLLLFYQSRREVRAILMVAVFLMLLIGFQLVLQQEAVDLSHYAHMFNQNSNEVCSFTKSKPWDETIRGYIQNRPPLECREIQSPLTFLHNRRLFFNKTAFDKVSDSLESVQCQGRCFRQGQNDDENAYDDWRFVENGTQVDCEFFEVKCRQGIFHFYSQLHAQIIPKQEAPSKMKRFDVTLFVLDSVSQSHWHRSLTQTLAILQQTYRSTIITGFNKVADNSFPNAIAFLAGLRNEGDKLPAQASEFNHDNGSLIWENFQEQGYVTFYAEDYPKFNLFNYLSKGFDKEPVDHYLRPYWLEVYDSFVYRRSTYLCYNVKPMHLIQMNYYRDLVHNYHSKRPFFALHWLTELAHDWLSQVSSSDKDIELLLKEEEQRLQDTFLFMFSDHGHRFDPIRQTMIGRLEERMPFFSMHIPQQLHTRFPELTEVLEWNSRQLASFFDLYVTLRDILDLQERDAWSELRQKNQPLDRFRRISAHGLSLLRPLPENRTCEEAGIPDEYCICQTEQAVNISDPIVQRAADCLIQHTNKILEPFHKQCAALKLKRVMSVRMSVPNKKLIGVGHFLHPRLFSMRKYDGGFPKGLYLNYVLMLKVGPSDAVLEGTVRRRFADDAIQVVGDVNRINRYSNQSACIRNAVARKYCYCI